MLISTLDSLLKNKYGQGASAYVPETRCTAKHGNNRTCKVSVTYSATGKAYTYNGTILSVAERLELIPEINVVAESDKIVRSLVEGRSVVGHSCCYDTIRFSLPSGFYLVQSDYSEDEYDRATCRYSTTTDKPTWL